MSKRNKVNPGQYTQAGRLSPDDAAREERKAAGSQGISNRETAAEERDDRQRNRPRDASSSSEVEDGADAPESASEGTQSSSKHGSRSTAQKTAEAKYVNRAHPGSGKVDGAFGREFGKKQ